MPQTEEYWLKRAHSDQELILKQRAEMAKLKCKNNDLEQKMLKYKALSITRQSQVDNLRARLDVFRGVKS